MATAKQAIAKEKSYIRARPYLPRPNKFSFGYDEPWCSDFQRHCLEAIDLKDWVKKFPLRFCNCEKIYDYAKKNGYVKYSGKPGDLVLFDWDLDKDCDHIGMVVKKNNNGSYTTVEGNTSNTSNGNGNCVQQRVRETRYIKCFVRPPYTTVKITLPKKKSYTGKLPTLVKHSDGKYLRLYDTGTSVKNLQKFLNWYMKAGLKVDGSYGKLTREAVKDFQERECLKVDGYFGQKSLDKARAYKK